MQSQPGDVYIPSQFLSPQQLEERQREQQQQQQPLNGVSPPPYNPSYVPQQFVAPTPQQYHPPTNSNAVAPPPATAPITTYGGSTNATDPALFDALAETERLIIKQEVEWLEAAANNAANAVNLDALGAFGEQANKYDIFTDDGGKKFRVVETSNYFCRCCLRPNHELQLHVFLPEDTQNKVMVLDRPWKFGYCCSLTDVCQQEMKVYQGKHNTGCHQFMKFSSGVYA